MVNYLNFCASVSLSIKMTNSNYCIWHRFVVMVISKVIRHEKSLIGKVYFRILNVLCKYKHSLKKKLWVVMVNGEVFVRIEISNESNVFQKWGKTAYSLVTPIYPGYLICVIFM